jgi:hypothetical protein
VPATEVLIVSGFQVPVIPLFEVAGRRGATLFWQRGPIWMNDGVIEVVTSMFIVADIAHCPASGVNVYVVVLTVKVFNVSGFQVPEIPLFEVPGRLGADVFWQSGPI